MRLEIAAALRRNIRVVPALVAGARIPPARDLPADLAGLAHRNALEITDANFREGVNRLIAALERALAAAQDQRGREQLEAERTAQETAAREQREPEQAPELNAT